LDFNFLLYYIIKTKYLAEKPQKTRVF